MVVRTTSKNDLARKEVLQCKDSVESQASASSAPDSHIEEEEEETENQDNTNAVSESRMLMQSQWIANPKATSFFIKILTSIYVLLLTIVSCIIELSTPWNSYSLWLGETIFSLLMYLIAIIFFIYTYIFVIYPKFINSIIMFLNKKTSWVPRPDRYIIEEPVHNGEGAGTLYLRFGALVFGTLGSVLWGCEIYLCFSDASTHAFTISKFIAAIVFTYLQMHFIFCNSKITFKKSNHLASFGMMHCVAVNIWTWFSLCLVKRQVKHLKKIKTVNEHKPIIHDWSSSEELEMNISTVAEKLVEVAATKTMDLIKNTTQEEKMRMLAMAKLGDISNFLLTCLVEFSLIGAAICFIIWKYMGETHLEGPKEKKKKYLRMECASITIGLFAGIIFMIGSFVTIGIYGMLYNQQKYQNADLVIGIVNLILFVVSLLACFFGMWRMRVLQYRVHAHGEIIDEILLIIGLIGELTYCSVGFDLIVESRRQKTYTSNLAVAVFLFRIVQVVVQFIFILIGSRLRCLTKTNAHIQPGKQTLTFLVLINITLFVYHTFVGMKSSFGFPNTMESKYFELLNGALPLVVFYRFHSSACLAEIWKHTYSTKRVHSSHH